MATTAEKRRANRARRLIRSEFRWLQKAMFALSKAEDARDKLVDVSNDDVREFVVDLGGTQHDVADVGTALRDVIEERMHEQRLELRERLQRR